MTFPWLTRSAPTGGAAARHAGQLRELRDRAGLFYRLGYTVEAATARLTAAVTWEHADLSDAAIAQVVRETYARRPSGEL